VSPGEPASPAGHRGWIPFPGEAVRLPLVVRVLAVSVLACLAFSPRLWISSRRYPLTPVANLMPPFPAPLDALALAILVGFLATLVVQPRWRWPVAGVVVSLGVLFLQDQSRLWPSFYEFFLLFLLALPHPSGTDQEDDRRSLAGMQFVVAAVYFWGGFHKLTTHFVSQAFPWFVQPWTNAGFIPAAAVPWLAGLVPAYEMAVGIGLLTRRFRRPALAAALAMHLVILACIGPLREHWNNAAWGWSLATAVLAWTLFAAAPPFTFAGMFAAPRIRCLPQLLVAVLLGMLPALNGLNRWDSALSFNVYTGNTTEGYVQMRPEAAARLPPELVPHVSRHGDWAVLDLNAWSRREFNAGCYPEPRIYRRLFATVCGWIEDPAARLVIFEKAGWFRPRERSEVRCDEP
jgi:hypothetical protein